MPSSSCGIAVDDAGDHLAHAVLDEARAPVGLLDDGALVGALHQLVDLRAHRALDDREQVLRVDVGRCSPRGSRCSSVPRPRWLWVATGTCSKIRSICSSSKPSASRRSRDASATRPWAHGQAVMPCAATPTSRRVPRSLGDRDAVAACRAPASRSPRPGRACARGSGPRSRPRRGARPGARGRRSAMRWASCSARNADSPRTTSPIASLTTSSKRDMCAPFCCGPRSTKHSSRAQKRLLAVLAAEADHLLDAGDARRARARRGRWGAAPARPSRKSQVPCNRGYACFRTVWPSGITCRKVRKAAPKVRLRTGRYVRNRDGGPVATSMRKRRV